MGGFYFHPLSMHPRNAYMNTYLHCAGDPEEAGAAICATKSNLKARRTKVRTVKIIKGSVIRELMPYMTSSGL